MTRRRGLLVLLAPRSRPRGPLVIHLPTQLAEIALHQLERPPPTRGEHVLAAGALPGGGIEAAACRAPAPACQEIRKPL